MKKFDVKALASAPWNQVLAALGSEQGCNKNYHCPLHEDKNASLGITEADRTQTGQSICHCFSCDFSGNPINLTMEVLKMDFKTACEWLHGVLGIPFLNESVLVPATRKVKPKSAKAKTPLFDAKRQYVHVEVAKFLPQYHKMSDAQKLKLAYTAFYRMSLRFNQTSKNDYYARRGIDVKKLDAIGVVAGGSERKQLQDFMLKHFPLADLQRFKLFKESGVIRFGYGYSVVPNMDVYSDMAHGLQIRYFTPKGNLKELNICCSDIVRPNLFGLTNEVLRSARYVYITEGHIDALSLTLATNEAACSLVGAFNCSDEAIALLKNKDVIVALDKDAAGIKASEKLCKRLCAQGFRPYVLSWDEKIAKDINELRQKGALRFAKPIDYQP